MKPKSTIIVSLLCVLPFALHGQAIDNTLSFKNINNDNYIRFNIEEGFFANADWYYTAGIHAEVVAPWIRRFPLSKILFHPKHGHIRYGLGIEDDMYTPTSISKSDILYGDRPYTGCLFLKTFVIDIDSGKKQRFSTTLSTGVIGTVAGNMDLQIEVHRILPNNVIPQGWVNQIHNDAILNYQVDYEKQLLSSGHLFSLDADGLARAGTLSDKAGVGITAIGGYFDSPFSSEVITKNNFRLYAYDHPEIDVIGYDATMEGGVFNHTSPYTITPGNIRRFTFQNRYGFVCVVHRVNLAYARTFLTSEFNTGLTHEWGNVEIAFGF